MTALAVTVSQLISNQSVFAEKDVAEFVKSDYSLGYLFGMAEMAVYQSGGSFEDHPQTLSDIHFILSETFGRDASDVVLKALKSQANDEFAKGRDIGSQELGQWINTQGQYVPMGLTRA